MGNLMRLRMVGDSTSKNRFLEQVFLRLFAMDRMSFDT